MSEESAARGEEARGRRSSVGRRLGWTVVALALVLVVVAFILWDSARQVRSLRQQVHSYHDELAAAIEARDAALSEASKLREELAESRALEAARAGKAKSDWEKSPWRGWSDEEREEVKSFLERAPNERGTKAAAAGSRAVFDFIMAYYGGPPGCLEESLALKGLADDALRAAREVLLACLEHPDGRVRIAGLQGLSGTCGYDLPGAWREIRERLIPACVKALRDPDPFVRGEAAGMLGHYFWPPAREALVEAIRSEREDTALTRMMYAFCGYARAEDAELLCDKILDGELREQGRNRALCALRELPGGLDSDVYWKLVSDRGLWSLREEAGRTLAFRRRREDFERWFALFRDAEDDRDRERLIGMLAGGWLFEPEALAIVKETLLDSERSEMLRRTAASVLRKIHGPVGTEELVRVALDEKAPSYLRTRCLQIAARNKGDPRAMELAREAAKGPADHPFVAALHGIFLRRRGPELSEHLPALVARMKPGNARDCIDALLQYTGGPAAVRYYVEEYRKGRKDSNPSPGREGILRALADFGAPEAETLAGEALIDAGSSRGLRRAAMYAAARLGSKALAGLVESEIAPARPVRDRRYAIWALCYADPDRAVALMPRFLLDPQLRIRDMALRMCFHLKRAEFIEPLRKSLAEEPEIPTKVLAAAALAASGGGSGKEYPVETLREQAKRLPEGLVGLRYVAWWAHEAAPEETKPVLEDMLSSPSRYVRQTAAYHLVRCPGDRERKRVLVPLLWNRPSSICMDDEHYEFLAGLLDEPPSPDRALAVKELRYPVGYCPDSATYRKALAEYRALEKEDEGERLPGEPRYD